MHTAPPTADTTLAVTLAIETSNPSATADVSASAPGVAIARGPVLLGIEPIHPQARHDDALMPAIDRLARKLGIQPRSIQRIAVSTGPGGFSGLRIAIAAAKMIAEATGARCIAVPSARVVAARVQHDGRPFAVVLNSKGESAHYALFDPDGRPTDRQGDLDASMLSCLAAGRLIADQFLPRSIAAEAERLGMTIERPVFDAAACLECSWALPEIDPAELLPFYAREPEAVTKWRLRESLDKPKASPPA
ncbi:MAG: tRNA (adenosine(37)-N6)-threonylcarbamoyltransferase complex dimerization subunit type 1 TsaB [Phycisphaeraceae bacterium]|nr:tRNA (adenosine(37)-N6)-threonylcarbamoyltransferase complex dimerization subunit type 1 TsaB [Phycisphaeraceae bacterium]MCW5755042.1 tRNA (adenosine(37)-N6)-threonylcarbamoyltransferase complex dimerization subunit type 1 TsaB [Phycisphaeraceae bacterium]